MRSPHPRYKYFPETGEERYHSFLGVPMLERGTPLGVLVVQTLRRRKFSANELRLLRAIAAQVAGIVVQARLLEDLESKEKERREYRRRMVDAIQRLQRVREARPSEPDGVARRKRREQSRLDGAAGGAGLRPRTRAPAAARGQLRADRGASQPTDPAREVARFQRAVDESVRELEAPEGSGCSRAPAGVRQRASSTRTG